VEPADGAGRLSGMSELQKPVVSTTEARQGTTHQGVRFVLGISVALAVVAMAVAYFVA
jgi:hypothetical protein